MDYPFAPKLTTEQRNRLLLIIRAAEAEQLSLVSCSDAEGQPVAALCVVTHDADDLYTVTPVARLLTPEEVAGLKSPDGTPTTPPRLRKAKP